MRRYGLFPWIVSTFIFTTVLFQNCSQYKPELNASDAYSVGAESIGESHADDDAIIAEVVSGSSINFTQSVPEYSNIWSPIFFFSLDNSRVSAVVSYQCKVDKGEWSPCASPFKLDSLADGMHSLSVKAVYKSLAESIPKDVVWTKDSLVPLVAFNKTPPTNIGTNEVEITFSATDGGSGIDSYSCLFNSGEWKSCTSPINFSELAEGSHTFKVRVMDKAGNINEVQTSWNFSPLYPYISLTGKPEAFIKESSAEFAFELMNGLSFNRFECQFSTESEFKSCASGVSYNLNSDGQYTFKVRARDSQGYLTSTLSYQFYRDATGPKIELISPNSGSKFANSFVVAVNVDDGEAGSGVDNNVCKLTRLVNGESSDQSIANCKFPLDLSSELTGEYKLSIESTDKLGNTSQSNEFQFYYLAEEQNPGFITINLSGGAALAANVIPLDENGQLLDSYSKMGMGNKAYVEANNENYVGAKWYKDSGILKGMKAHMSADAEAKAQVYAIPVGSVDNSSNNPFDIQTYISSAGLKGTFIRSAANASGKMLNGINQTTIFSGKSGLELNLTAVFKPFSGFLDLSNHSGYTKFQDFPMITEYDAYSVKDFTDIFDTDTNKTGTPAATKQIIYNSINGNIGPASLNFNGYDYRKVSRGTSDASDFTIGEWIGKSIEYAYKSKKKLMIYVVTDGSAGSAESNTGGGNWTVDRGVAGQLLLFIVDPIDGVPTSNYASDYMIGNFISSSQSANDAYFYSSDPRVNAREMAGLAVVANYLQFAGHDDKIETVTQSLIKNEDVPKFVKIRKVVRSLASEKQ
tara:strand:+ start:2727 stop:5144 length:2418 start_codon:yes stop_codon:yes gene_type:complete